MRDWAWGGDASCDGFCGYAYVHAVETYSDATGEWEWDGDALLRQYLVSVGESPRDYGL